MIQNLKVLFLLIFIVSFCTIKRAVAQNIFLPTHYEQNGNDKLSATIIDTTKTVEFGITYMFTLSFRNKSDYTWDEFYYLGLNHSILVYFKYKKHNLSAGLNFLCIPQISINDFSNNSNRNNIGMQLGYAYDVKIVPDKYRILIQYFFRYSKIEYQTYSLGQGLYNSDYKSIENTVGLGFEFKFIKYFYCSIGLNVGFRDDLIRAADIIGTGDIAIFYKF